MKKIKIISLILIVFMICIVCEKGRVYAFSHSKGEIVIDIDSGRILSELNSEKKLPMASTTKIVTCITAIENFDTESIVTVKKEYCGVEGSSIYLREG